MILSSEDFGAVFSETFLKQFKSFQATLNTAQSR